MGVQEAKESERRVSGALGGKPRQDPKGQVCPAKGYL